MVDFEKQTEEFRVPTRLAKPGKMITGKPDNIMEF